MEISTRAKETITAVVHEIFLWATASSTNKSPRKPPSFYDKKSIGLTSILFSKNGYNGTKNVVHSCTITSSTTPSAQTITSFSFLPLSSSTSWSSSTTGDLLGTESGVFMSSGEDTIPAPWENVGEPKPSFSTQRDSSRIRVSKTNDIPPPISYLRHEGIYKGVHSWYLGRECVDGRLILIDTCASVNNYFDDAVFCCEKVEVDDGLVENIEENGNGPNEIFFSSDVELFKNMGNKANNEISFASSVPEESMLHDMKINVGQLRRSVSYSGGLDSIIDFLDLSPCPSIY